jgi:predicted  nucleic acid-binding Zn-ribbon protein
VRIEKTNGEIEKLEDEIESVRESIAAIDAQVRPANEASGAAVDQCVRMSREIAMVGGVKFLEREAVVRE